MAGRKLKGKSSQKGQLHSTLARYQTNELQKKKIAKKTDALANKNKKNPDQKKQTQKPQHHQNKSFIPFTPNSKLLLVGEGDFSFALSILKEGRIKPQNLIITSFDNSATELQLKYPTTFAKNYEEIKTFKDIKVFFKVDGTQLVKTLKVNTKAKFVNVLGVRHIDFVLFNFPHTGKGIKDQDRNIRDHQLLVLGFLKSCQELFKIASMPSNPSIGDTNIVSEDLPEPKIILSVFEGQPYDSWNIKMLSKSVGLKVETSGAFDWESFPGYHHRRTNSEQRTTKEASERKARMYVFEKFKKDPTKKRKSDDDSDDE